MKMVSDKGIMDGGILHMQLDSALTLEEQLHRLAPQGKRKMLFF